MPTLPAQAQGWPSYPLQCFCMVLMFGCVDLQSRDTCKALFSNFCVVCGGVAEKHIFTFPFNIFLIWRGGGAISLMESDRILLCLMKFRLKNETETLRTVNAKTTLAIVLLFGQEEDPRTLLYKTQYNTGKH